MIRSVSHSSLCPCVTRDCIFYDTSDLIPLKPQVSDNKLELLFMVSTRKDHRHILSRGLRWTGTNHRYMLQPLCVWWKRGVRFVFAHSISVFKLSAVILYL